MEIIVARHGVTQTNVDDIANGQLDEPLNEDGKLQAEEMAARLAPKGIECIYSSPLNRTVMTARPLAQKLNKTVITDHRLIEVGCGRFAGKPNTEIKEELGSSLRELYDQYAYDLTPFGGESSGQVEARVRSFLEDLKKQPYKKVLVVTHGGTFRWISFLGTGKKIGMQPNARELSFRL